MRVGAPTNTDRSGAADGGLAILVGAVVSEREAKRKGIGKSQSGGPAKGERLRSPRRPLTQHPLVGCACGRQTKQLAHGSQARSGVSSRNRWVASAPLLHCPPGTGDGQPIHP